MNINFSKFKAVKRDNDHTILQHPDGHAISISHAALSPKMRKQIMSLPMLEPESKDSKESGAAKDEDGELSKVSAFDGGGTVTNPACKDQYGANRPCTEEDYAKNSGLKPSAPDKSKEGGDPGKDKEAAEGFMKSFGFAEGGKVAAYDEGTQEPLDWSTPPQEPSNQEPISAGEQFRNFLTGSPQNSEQVDAQEAAKKMIPGADAGLSSKPATANIPTPQTTQEGLSQPLQSAQDTSDTTKPKYTFGEANDQAIKGLQKEQSANTEIAKIQGQQSQAQQPALDQQAQAQQDVLDNYSEATNHLNDVYQQTVDAINANHIDPNDYINKMSTGGKIATGIGIILGGMGQGLMRSGSNPAVDFLNNQINRNIDAQKANLGKQENLLSANLKQYGNVNTAAEVTRMQELAITKAQIDRTANQFGTPMAKQQAILANGAIDQKIAEVKKQAAMMGVLQGAQQSGNPRQTIAALRMMGQEAYAKNLEEKLVPGVGPNGSDVIAGRPVSDEIRAKLLAHKQLDDAGKDLLEWTKTHTTLVPGTADYNTGVEKSLNYTNAIRAATLGGIYKQGEQPLLDKYVDQNPANLLKAFSTEPKLHEAIRNNQVKYQRLMQYAGIPGVVSRQYTPTAPKTK